jgi:hypothetical protein
MFNRIEEGRAILCEVQSLCAACGHQGGGVVRAHMTAHEVLQNRSRSGRVGVANVVVVNHQQIDPPFETLKIGNAHGFHAIRCGWLRDRCGPRRRDRHQLKVHDFLGTPVFEQL